MLVSLFNEGSWFAEIIAIILTIGCLTYLYLLKKSEIERKKKISEFQKIALDAFENDTISEIDDLSTFFNSQIGENSRNVYKWFEIKKALEIALTKISSSNPGGNLSKLKSRLDELRDLIQSVTKKLESEEQIVPFYGTPEEERQLLEDILELTRTDRGILRKKLSELASLVSAREQTFLKLGERSKSSRIWAICGGVGTFFFGFISIYLGFIK